MKKVILILAILLKSFLADAQIYPDCSHFKVEKISVTDSGYIALELSNSCTNCLSGIDGCVYGEMKIINRFDATDIIAATDCYCLMTPPNEGISTYLIPSSLNALPPVSDMRVFFHCGEMCQDIVISGNALHTSGKLPDNSFRVYPNPISDRINLEYESAVQLQHIQLSDISGKVIRTFAGNEKVLNMEGLANGVYFLRIKTRDGILTEKVVIN